MNNTHTHTHTPMWASSCGEDPVTERGKEQPKHPRVWLPCYSLVTQVIPWLLHFLESETEIKTASTSLGNSSICTEQAGNMSICIHRQPHANIDRLGCIMPGRVALQIPVCTHECWGQFCQLLSLFVKTHTVLSLLTTESSKHNLYMPWEIKTFCDFLLEYSLYCISQR